MTRKTQTLKKVKSQKKSKSQLHKTRKVRKHKGGDPWSAGIKAAQAAVKRAAQGNFRKAM